MSATETHAAAMQCASIPLGVTTVVAKTASSAIHSSDVNKYKWDHAPTRQLAFAAIPYHAPSITSASITSA